MPEPTPAQNARVAELKEVFGAKIVKQRYVLKHNGMLWVDLECAAGTWRFSYDRDGELRHASLDQLLQFEDMNADTARSGALPKFAQDDNDT